MLGMDGVVMKKNIVLYGCFCLCCILFLGLSGCTNIFPGPDEDIITYEAQPTCVLCHFAYGYNVNVTGLDPFTLHYYDALPNPFNGSVYKTNILNAVYATSYSEEANTIVFWNLSTFTNFNDQLGVNASIQIDDYLVSDLTGSGALTLQQIKNMYPTILTQYTQVQGNETDRIIDPHDPNIQTIAENIQTKANTTNSFILAKELFIWLKQNTQYKTHTNPNIQPAAVTLQTKTGDCDDLSSLYISFCRALDIPARFVRGYLLSEEDGTVTSVGHAWVDVFVGGTYGKLGWMPVECSGMSDATTEVYLDFGREDAYHIRIYEDIGTNASFQEIISPITIQYTEGTSIGIERFFTLYSSDILASKSLCIKNKTIRYLC